MKVKATGKYEELRLEDKELKRVLKKDEEFEVSKERFEILNGNNPYKAIFAIPVLETAKADKEKAEKAVLKATKKAK